MPRKLTFKSSGHRTQDIEIHFRFGVAVATAIADSRNYQFINFTVADFASDLDLGLTDITFFPNKQFHIDLLKNIISTGTFIVKQNKIRRTILLIKGTSAFILLNVVI